MRTPVGEGEVAVCPTCDTTRFHVNTPDAIVGAGSCGRRYWCWECEDGFDEYEVRPRKGHSGLSGLAADLAAADPDEVSR
jgi:hypothetical protein